MDPAASQTQGYDLRDASDRGLRRMVTNDPTVSVVETDGGPAMILELEDRQESYMIRNLYIADGNLMHRDWLRNTNLGPVSYVRPEAGDAR